MSKKINKFSIIIANYNGEEYLWNCLSSVFASNYPKFEVIIVEDGSTDGSMEIIQKFQKKYKMVLIQNKKNLGLVANRNKAIKRAKGDILVFLDNDTEVDKNWIRSLNDVFSKDETVGAAQCKMFDFHKRKILQQVGMKLVPYTGFGMTLGRGEKDHGQYDLPMEIISLGAALAVRRQVVKKIQGFDQKLFHYTDDLDFSWRVWIAGFRIVLAPKAKVYHYIKIHKPTYKLYFHLCKNSIRMIVKNYELINVLKFLPLSFVFSFVGGIYVLVSRRSFAGVFGVLIGVVWSIINFGDNLRQRVKVQEMRRLSDFELSKKIMVSEDIFSFYKRYFRGAKITINLMSGR